MDFFNVWAGDVLLMGAGRMPRRCCPLSNLKAPSCLGRQSHHLRSDPRSIEMDHLIPTKPFTDAIIEILPPERDTCTAADAKPCLCCGRHAAMDDDCCNICEECLSL